MAGTAAHLDDQDPHGISRGRERTRLFAAEMVLPTFALLAGPQPRAWLAPLAPHQVGHRPGRQAPIPSAASRSS